MKLQNAPEIKIRLRGGFQPFSRAQLDTTAIIARRNRSAGVLADEFGRRPAARIQPNVRPRSETLQELAAGTAALRR